MTARWTRRAAVLGAALIATACAAAPAVAAPAAPPGATQTTTTFSSTATQAVPGFGQGSLTSTVTVSGAGTYLSDVQVFTKLFHTFPADLRVTLASPSGATVVLTDGFGGGNDDAFSATRWSDGAGAPVATASFTNGVATAALTPQQAFSRFLGSDPNGIWKLTITDQAADDDTGILRGWSLDVSTLAEPPILTRHHGETSVSSGSTPITAGSPLQSTISLPSIPVGTVWGVRVSPTVGRPGGVAVGMTLTGPSGRTVQLRPLRSGDLLNFTTEYDDVPSGSMVAPLESLGAFRGEDAEGDWTLTVTTDAKVANPAQFFGWSLDVVTAATIPPPKAGALCNPTSKSFAAVSDPPKPVNHGIFSPTNGWTSLDLPVSGVGTYLHGVQVTTQVSTPNASTLRLQLVAPNGRAVWLTRDHGNDGGSPTTYEGAVFDDAAGAINPPGSIAETFIPANGTASPVVPLQPLSGLVGVNPNGTWQLRAFSSRCYVVSGCTGEGAKIKGFSLRLATQGAPPARQKTTVNFGPASAPPGPGLTRTLTISGAGPVLDQLDMGLIAPALQSGDLMILRSPAGTQVTLNSLLANADGAGNAMFANTTFTDMTDRSVAGMLSTASGPDTGQTDSSRVSPLQALGAFRGENPNGTWALTIVDPAFNAVAFKDWSLTARTAACADTTPPANPTITSPTHTAGATSADPDLDIALAGASDDVGVDGFSYVLDHNASTVPDTTKNAPASTTSLPFHGLADGTWYFHLRTVDAAGNWSDPVHFGPVTIDTLLPDTTIATGPTGITTATPTFTFTANKAPVTYECAIDLGAYTTCATPFTTPTLADGPHTLSVRAKDGLGRVDPTPDARSFTVDSTLPDTTITGGPTGLIAATTPSWTFTASKTGATFRCAMDAGTPAACTSPFTAPALTNGPHTFSVYAVDPAGNADPTPDTRAVTVDTVPPDTIFTSGPADGASVNAAPSFGLGATEAPVTYQCKIDAGAYATCTSPFATAPLAAGTHTVSVRATDAAGNVDPTPATRTFTLDTTPPDTSFAGGPTGTVNTSQPVLNLASTEPGSTFECAVDLGLFAPCTSPWKTPVLSDGPHILYARATDPAGNVDATPAARALTVDTTAPDTILGGTPTGTTGVSPQFTFSSPDIGVTFECSVDGGAFSACSSPVTLGPLSGGAHRFDVRAVDGAGNRDATPAGRAFTVDATAPVTRITGAPVVTTSTARAQVTFTSDDPTATYECRVDDDAYASCTSPWTTGALADGSHTADVRATDAYGNTGAAASAPFTVDTVAPGTSIDSGPAATITANAATFAFSSDDPTATFECNVDAENFYAPCTSPKTLTGLSEGPHTFRVRARDAAGNFDASPATRTFTVDTVAPQTTIDSGPDTTSGVNATFTFSSEPGATFRCSLDGAAATTCTSPKTYTGLTAGPHTFSVFATDTAGNADPTPATRSFTADLSVPTATIITGPTADAQINTATPDFTFTSSKPGSTFLCAFDSDPLTACSTPYRPPTLSQGLRTFWVVAVDPRGNTSIRAQRTFTVDLTAPNTTVVTAPAATSVTGGATGQVASSEPGTFECNLDGGAWAACDATWVTPTMSNGVHRIGVRAVDRAGNRDATPLYFDVTVAIPAQPVTPLPPVTEDIGNAISLTNPTSATPTLTYSGTPLRLTHRSVTVGLRCPSAQTQPCPATFSVTVLSPTRLRGRRLAYFDGTIQQARTTNLRGALSTRNRRSLASLRTVRLRLTVTLGTAGGRSVTDRWERAVRIG